MLKKPLIIACAAFGLTFAVATGASAQFRSDKAIYFTFSAPVTIPNATLPAGKYLFRLADSLVNRTIVQIYSADGAKLHAMLMTLPQIRQTVAESAEVRFLETPANQAPAIATYWYPGEKNGWEFIYPREQARRLAEASKQPVLTTAQAVQPSAMDSAELVRVSPTGDQSAAAAGAEAPGLDAADRVVRGEEALDAPAPAPAPRAVQQSARAQTTTREALPATASPLPMLTLGGVGFLFLAFALNVYRRRA